VEEVLLLCFDLIGNIRRRWDVCHVIPYLLEIDILFYSFDGSHSNFSQEVCVMGSFDSLYLSIFALVKSCSKVSTVRDMFPKGNF
jgi:hypothetical protein